MFLHRRHQRLNDEHVGFATAGASCTPTQSLLKRLMAAGLSGVFSRLQMSRASAWCALPVKTTIRFIGRQILRG